MRIPFVTRCTRRPDVETGQADGAPQRQLRRGATSMEYVVVISFIAMALILGVQHLGSVTNGLFTAAATKTK